MSDPKKAPTGHVIGATYKSAYWGGTYRVLGASGEYGVEVQCVTPGAGAHQTPGERWTHLTPLNYRDEMVEDALERRPFDPEEFKKFCEDPRNRALVERILRELD